MAVQGNTACLTNRGGRRYNLSTVINECLVYMCTSLAQQISSVSLALKNSSGGGAAAIFQGAGKLVLQLIDSVFSLAHKHIELLASAWRPLLDCVLRLNSGKLKLCAHHTRIPS